MFSVGRCGFMQSSIKYDPVCFTGVSQSMLNSDHNQLKSPGQAVIVHAFGFKASFLFRQLYTEIKFLHLFQFPNMENIE